ncbi:MAG: hypothetical protein HPY64_17035 [Anaerolineae bacterium]|nr:hypothetical protein [Anaerolineae bacterium]
MQRNGHHMVVVDDHLLDDLGQKLLACFIRFVRFGALLPICAEVADQIGGLMQLIVVDRAQGLGVSKNRDMGKIEL